MSQLLKEWERHIQYPTHLQQNKAWCGASVYRFDMPYETVDDALHAVLAETRQLPCPACIQAIIHTLAQS